jgi:hypothetical protein
MFTSTYRQTNNRKRAGRRLLTTALILAASVSVPWPITVFSMFGAALWFPRYYEAVAVALFYDLLFRPLDPMFAPMWSMTVLVAIGVMMIEILRVRIRHIHP